MRLIKGSLVGLILAGILALAPAAAFAHGGGGGGHGGGGGGHGGGDGGFGGGGHFGGFAGHGFAGHGFTQYQGAHFARHGNHFRHDGNYSFGYDYPYNGYDYPYYGYDYPYDGYYDDYTGDYSDGQSSAAEVTPSQGIIIAVQKELTQLGYYHGSIDGVIGPQTEGAIRWFQSVASIPVTGQIDDATLNALRIS